MLLLIDAGNSLIKWALAPADMSAGTGPASWLHAGETPHHETDTLYDLWQQVKPERAVSRVLISNVAGITAKERLTDLIRKLQPEPDNIAWFASAPVLAGVKNSYDDFSQLGSDRFASLVGARSLFPNENLVVVTCGTATTIDTLSSDGVFIGGMILPGLRLMANSLAGNTAQLPDIGQMTENIPAFATDTISAIRNGCMTAQAGAIEHAVTVHAKPLGNVRCILSGGAAKLVMPYLSIPAQIVDNLVLIGLHAADAQQHASDPLC
ncbi:type III pantothenate kinase [Oxalobacter vibrioformis]|uniref:Type III pantothenate kinase n=1 Tax=Oxalobacter vibrioformis TaxID=933080 RepID=A0A9E9LXC6_9BURK|nr:type III pantothenate kinase [Oxalobacter vibrioformis]WAW08973.1 type III pantothenate kinase [Oxalobacter vibrioformis]